MRYEGNVQLDTLGGYTIEFASDCEFNSIHNDTIEVFLADSSSYYADPGNLRGESIEHVEYLAIEHDINEDVRISGTGTYTEEYEPPTKGPAPVTTITSYLIPSSDLYITSIGVYFCGDLPN